MGPLANRRLVLSPLTSLSILLVTGCDDAEIRTYTIPKQDAVYAANYVEGPDRMLAALIPSQGRGWFFKLSGLKEPVGEQSQAFRDFLTSVRFDPKSGDPEWDLPEGWLRKPSGGGGMRFATLQIGSADDPLELSVIVLPMPASDFDAYLLQNVNRWRGQLKLSAITREQLAEETESLPSDDLKVTLVKNLVGHMKSTGPMTGPFAGGGDGARPGPPMRPPPGPAPGPTSEPVFRYTTPEGWEPGEKTVSRGGITIRRQAAFLVQDEADRGEVTVTAMPVGRSRLLLNVNRWRRQVALDPLTPDALDAATEPITIGSIKGRYLELTGPRDTILGTIVETGGMTWFFKLTGSSRLARNQRKQFRGFVRSSHFGEPEEADDGRK